MLRLSKLTDYAVVVLTRLARGGAAAPSGPVQTAQSLAGETGIAEPTVAKVLKLLAHAGLVEGVRGARGGYRATRPSGAVPLSEVIAAIDGPIALTACVDGSTGLCEAESHLPRPRPLGPGERRHPPRALRHHPGRHGAARRRRPSPSAAPAAAAVLHALAE